MIRSRYNRTHFLINQSISQFYLSHTSDTTQYKLQNTQKSLNAV